MKILSLKIYTVIEVFEYTWRTQLLMSKKDSLAKINRQIQSQKFRSQNSVVTQDRKKDLSSRYDLFHWQARQTSMRKAGKGGICARLLSVLYYLQKWRQFYINLIVCRYDIKIGNQREFAAGSRPMRIELAATMYNNCGCRTKYELVRGLTSRFQQNTRWLTWLSSNCLRIVMLFCGREFDYISRFFFR